MNQDVANSIESLRSLACTHKLVAWDTETTDLNPLVGKIRLMQFAVGGQPFVFDLFHMEVATYMPIIKWVLESPDIVKIAHNAKFDAKYAMYHLGIEPVNLFDTMLVSQILAAGDVTAQHGLDDCAFQWLGITLDKEFQTSDWSGELSTGQLQYAVNDVLTLEPLYNVFMAQLRRRGLIRCAELEFDAIVPIADTELVGFPLSRQQWSELLERKVETRARLSETLTLAMAPGIDWETKNPARYKRPLKPKLKKRDEGYAEAMAQYQIDMEAWNAVPKMVGGLINLGSPIQIKKVLGNLTGQDWFKLTTRDHVLALYADRFPIVAQLQEYRSADKLVTGYGENWLARLDADGRIRADFRQIGAETGRMACGGGVNLQNPPNDHNKELCADGCKCHRGCFIAPEGRVFIISDYSQIELRIAANYSQDPTMMAAFNSGEDLHKFTASIMFNVPVAEVSKEQRDLAKRANFLCMIPTTKVLTADFRWVEAGTLQVGDRLLAFDDVQRDTHQRRWRVSTVEHTGICKAPVQTLYLEDGTELTGTPHHKFIATGAKSKTDNPDQGGLRWTTIGHVQIGTHLAKILPLWESLTSFEDGWMSGFMDGEGHVRKRHIQLGFSQKKGELRNRAANWLREHDYDFGFSTNESDVDWIYLKGGVQTSFRFLGTVRPQRLLTNAAKIVDSCGRFEKMGRNQIVAKSKIFEADIVELQTSTGTYLTDGYGSHNTVYGGSARKLSGVSGLSYKEAEIVLEKYFATYAKLDTWLRYLARQAQEHRYTRTGSGRIVRYFNPEPETAHEQIKVMAAIGRNGKNAPIQGTSADILKWALRLLYNALKGTSAHIVNIVHDEIVVECDEGQADELVPIIEGAMIQAGQEYITRVPITVDSKISTSWIK